MPSAGSRSLKDTSGQRGQRARSAERKDSPVNKSGGPAQRAQGLTPLPGPTRAARRLGRGSRHGGQGHPAWREAGRSPFFGFSLHGLGHVRGCAEAFHWDEAQVVSLPRAAHASGVKESTGQTEGVETPLLCRPEFSRKAAPTATINGPATRLSGASALCPRRAWPGTQHSRSTCSPTEQGRREAADSAPSPATPPSSPAYPLLCSEGSLGATWGSRATHTSRTGSCKGAVPGMSTGSPFPQERRWLTGSPQPLRARCPRPA